MVGKTKDETSDVATEESVGLKLKDLFIFSN